MTSWVTASFLYLTKRSCLGGVVLFLFSTLFHPSHSCTITFILPLGSVRISFFFFFFPRVFL
ncbi:hypothetical protein B0J12DRAFT_658573, partial [Macrophomina phaseolina]